MPTYDYVCLNCGYKFEKFQKMPEDQMCIVDHAAGCGGAPAEAIAPVVGHKEI